MQTIVVNSQKGGSGKSTLCATLAAYVEGAGEGPVFIVDTDPQGTLTAWHSKREAEGPQRIELPFIAMAEGLKLLAAHGAKYVFIDTPPTRDMDADKLKPLTALFRKASLVLVPVRPSPNDLWAVADTVDILKREKVPFLFALNQVKPNASITAQAAAILSQYGQVANSFVGDRVPYAAAMTDGRTGVELSPKGPAAKEIADLWAGIKLCLHENMKTPKMKESA